MKQISICADDYGYSAGMSEAIRILIQNKRISATSAMTSLAIWPEEGVKLKELIGEAQLGLHFDLTSSIAPLSQWLMKSALRRIDTGFVRDELRRQLDQFTAVMGILPEHFDSHQHVHTFPQIREVVTQVLGEYYPEKNVPVRSLQDCMPAPDSAFKAWMIKQFSKGFHPENLRFPHNPSFGGIYSFSIEKPFAEHLDEWLDIAPNNTLLMVHPGIGDAIDGDEIHEARSHEFEYLNSSAFAEKLESLGIELGSFG